MNKSNIQVFNFNSFNVRTSTDEDNNILFCLKDVCKSLELTNHNKVGSTLDQDGVTTSYLIDSMGRKQNVKFIDESNLYQVIFQSRKEQAQKFKKWVTSEVIPSIRKTGKYEIQTEMDNITFAKNMIELSNKLIESEERKRELEEENKKLLPKANDWDEFLNMDVEIPMNEVAKLLWDKYNIKIGRNQLFKFLREQGILMKGVNHNQPKQKYMKAGYFNECPVIPLL